MSESAKETITGVLDGITEKPTGWTEILVRVDGWQYPVKMATKLAPLIELARAAGTEPMEWTFKKVVKDEINPNSGKPFVDRYFEGVAPLGANGPVITSNATLPPVGTTALPAAQNASEPVDWDSKERRDYRSRAWAQTLGAFTHTIKTDEDPVDVFLRLQPFQRKVYEDVCQSFAYSDDDIPFE